MSLNPDAKNTNPEDDYFARKNRELMARLKEQIGDAEAEKAEQALRDVHYMHCPKCGNALKEEVFQSIKIDRCTVCAGVWLDNGELEQISKSKGAWLSSFVDTFKLNKGEMKP